MKSFESEYLFALCNPGSEKALKLEVEMMSLEWRPSYQRRGFVTFKTDSQASVGTLDVPLAFARRLCFSFGKFKTREEAIEILKFEAASVIHHARFHERKMQGGSQATSHQKLEEYQSVGTVVELGSQEFWAGMHCHRSFLSPYPAGDSGLIMPDHSPSRAWLKLEEVARFFDIKFSPLDIVVELGCAPGGVVLALLDRGISVIGVDPAKMAEAVMKSATTNREHTPSDRAWFFHCRKPAALASKRDLGQGVTWFMSDMNQSPEVVIKECARFCKMATTIRGAILTLKLTDLHQIADKDKWLYSLAEIGFTKIRLQQLSVHHKELVIFALK